MNPTFPINLPELLTELRKTQSLSYYKRYARDTNEHQKNTYVQGTWKELPCFHTLFKYNILQEPPTQVELSRISPNSIFLGSKEVSLSTHKLLYHCPMIILSTSVLPLLGKSYLVLSCDQSPP